MLTRFLDSTTPSLKICGVTSADDARLLADQAIDAMGVNFWKRSKRYLPVSAAEQFLRDVSGRILRVGVFVNADPELPRKLFADGLIDLLQFHGDETPEYCAAFAADNIPFIKALPAKPEALENPERYRATAILVDTPAPGSYGGTGQTFDWSIAKAFIQQHPTIPVILAGGITVANAAEALEQVKPVAIDVASGGESTPGIKDFQKIRRILDTVMEASI